VRFSKLPPYASSRSLVTGGEELVEQVAVGRVDLRDLEANVTRALRGGRERVDHVVDTLTVQSAGRRQFAVVRVRVRVGVRYGASVAETVSQPRSRSAGIGSPPSAGVGARPSDRRGRAESRASHPAT